MIKTAFCTLGGNARTWQGTDRTPWSSPTALRLPVQPKRNHDTHRSGSNRAANHQLASINIGHSFLHALYVKDGLSDPSLPPVTLGVTATGACSAI